MLHLKALHTNAYTDALLFISVVLRELAVGEKWGGREKDTGEENV